MERGSGTRSGLLWEVERLLKECDELPQVLLMENVPQVHGKKNKASFDEWCEFLTSLGYKNYWKDLNSKDYGVPQNRNRCFMVSLIEDYCYEFPQPIPLQLKLQDLLEDEVDEKYYLSDKNNVKQGLTVKECKGISQLKKDVCNKALDFMTPTDTIDYTYSNARLSEMRNGFVKTKNKENNQIMNTLTTNCENFGVCVEEKQNLKKQLCNKLIEDGKVKENDIIRHSYTNNRLNNGDKNMGRIENHEGLSPTLDTRCDCLGICKNYRIRKLTPTECLRLMGVRDEYSKRITCSNAQKYKQAGNGIVVDVLMAIFKQML